MLRHDDDTMTNSTVKTSAQYGDGKLKTSLRQDYFKNILGLPQKFFKTTSRLFQLQAG